MKLLLLAIGVAAFGVILCEAPNSNSETSAPLRLHEEAINDGPALPNNRFNSVPTAERVGRREEEPGLLNLAAHSATILPLVIFGTVFFELVATLAPLLAVGLILYRLAAKKAEKTPLSVLLLEMLLFSAVAIISITRAASDIKTYGVVSPLRSLEIILVFSLIVSRLRASSSSASDADTRTVLQTSLDALIFLALLVYILAMVDGYATFSSRNFLAKDIFPLLSDLQQASTVFSILLYVVTVAVVRYSDDWRESGWIFWTCVLCFFLSLATAIAACLYLCSSSLGDAYMFLAWQYELPQ